MPPTGLRDSLQRFSDMASPGPTHQAWGRGVRVVVCSSKDSTAGTRGSALRQEPGGTAALQPRERGQPRRGQFSLRWLRAGPASPGSAWPAGVRGGGRPPWDQLGLRGSGARPHAATPTPTPAHGQPGIRCCGPLLPRLAGSRKPPRCCLHCVVSIGLLLVSADSLLKPEEKQQSVSVNAEKPVGVLA